MLNAMISTSREGYREILLITMEPTSVSIESLQSKITTGLQATHTEIVDMSDGCGQAYSATIISPLFEKKTMLARHRLVNTLLKVEIAAIHAWTVKCYTPSEWKTFTQ